MSDFACIFSAPFGNKTSRNGSDKDIGPSWPILMPNVLILIKCVHSNHPYQQTILRNGYAVQVKAECSIYNSHNDRISVIMYTHI